MRLHVWFALVAGLLLAGPLAAQTQVPSNEQSVLIGRTMDVLAVMKRQRSAGDVFNQNFLGEVSPQRLDVIVSQLEAQYGKVQTAYVSGYNGTGSANVVLGFQRANGIAVIELEPNYPRRVSGFVIRSVGSANFASSAPATSQGTISNTGNGAAIRSIADEFASLPGSAGYTLARLDDSGAVQLDARLPNQLFAIGSAFKLWVLDAVAEEVSSGRLSWSQVVPLGPRSLPSGMTQEWPAGAPVTVETLATLMISISDNTATDTLIRLVGRDKIEARVAATGHTRPAAMHPFLTTSDAFRLKLGSQAVRDSYARSDGNGRLQMVNGLAAGIDASQTDFSALASGKPVGIDSIEWFASPYDMVHILDALRRRSDRQVLAILGVSPGMAPDIRRGFTAAGFKGGSEPGVLNYSWLLRRPSGIWYVVTVSWNNPAAPIDNARLELLAQRLIAQTQ